MRVYAEVRPPSLGRAIYRINSELRAAAPDTVEFVSEAGVADLQILDVIGLGSLQKLEHPRYVLIQHCPTTAKPASWAGAYREAVLVISSHDLRGAAMADGFAFHRTPYGVDGSVFYDRDLSRNRTVLTTGYELGGEAIAECREAAMAASTTDAPQLIHVGAQFWEDGSVELHEGVTDSELAVLYSRARYVSGLRRFEGFELPVLEGLVCGARPVCFDTPGYRYWYDGHAEFVPEVPPAELVARLTECFARTPAPVTASEREEVLRRFSWPTICSGIWSEICERVATHRPRRMRSHRHPLASSITSGPRRVESLVIREAENGLIVSDPDRQAVHRLNPSAALIFDLADGTHPSESMAWAVASIYGLPSPPIQETVDGLNELAERRLIRWDADGADWITDPESMQLADAALAHGAMQSGPELAALIDMLREQELRAVVEIGTSQGGTLFLWCRLAHAEATIVSIDLPGGEFGGGYEEAHLPVLRSYGGPLQSLHLLQMDSGDRRARIEVERALMGRPIDLLFVDGDHTYQGVLTDFLTYAPLVRDGGLIVFHDLNSSSINAGVEVSRLWQQLTSVYECREIIHDDRPPTFGGFGVLQWNAEWSIWSPRMCAGPLESGMLGRPKGNGSE